MDNLRNLKSILDQLQAKDKALLIYSLEKGISQHVEYEPGRFIGVHMNPTGRLKSEQKVGNWAEGVISGNN